MCEDRFGSSRETCGVLGDLGNRLVLLMDVAVLWHSSSDTSGCNAGSGIISGNFCSTTFSTLISCVWCLEIALLFCYYPRGKPQHCLTRKSTTVSIDCAAELL